MKKYVKQIIVAVIVATLISCGIYCYDTYKNTPPAKAKTVTDAEGTTYLVVYDENGSEYVAVTDEAGNIYAANFDGRTVGEPVTDKNGNIYYLNGVNGSDLPVNTTAPAYSIDVVNSTQYTGEVSEKPTEETTTQPTTAAPTESTTAQTTNSLPTDTTKPEPTVPPTEPTQSPTEKPETTTGKPSGGKELLADKYKEVFKGGTYKMEFMTDDEELSESPVTAEFKNGDILMRTTLMGMDLTILYFPARNEGFIVMHRYKKYCKLPDSLMEDLKDTATTGAIDDGEYISVDVGDVVVDGETLVRERYAMEDGATVDYYFKDTTLVRRDRTEADGLCTKMFITTLTSDVPDSDFEIPQNYSNINISWLSFLLEGDEEEY